MWSRTFLEHPRAVGESYGEHFKVAGGFGLTMIGAGLACLVHAVFPGLHVKTGSDAVDRLHATMVVNRRGSAPMLGSDSPRSIDE